MLLTGTPISNKVDDLCSLIDILGVDARLAKIALLNAMRSEQKAALDKIKKHRHFVLDDDGEMEMDQDDDDDESNDDEDKDTKTSSSSSSSSSESKKGIKAFASKKEELNHCRKIINRCVIRRTKTELHPVTGKRILQLPSKVIKNNVSKLQDADLDAYKAIEDHLRAEARRLQRLVNKGDMNKAELSMSYLAILNQMRMAASNVKMLRPHALTGMVPPQIVAKLTDVSSKMKRCLEGRCLVFFFFSTLLLF